MGINMRTETEMLDVILKTAKTLQVAAVAMSGSRTDTKAPKDEFKTTMLSMSWMILII